VSRAASAGKNKAAAAMPGQHTKNPEASENPAGGAGAATAATAPLLAEAAASTDKNKAAHARAAASRTKNPEGGNGAGPNEKAIEESSVLPRREISWRQRWERSLTRARTWLTRWGRPPRLRLRRRSCCVRSAGIISGRCR
jgi:hypothetical protein